MNDELAPVINDGIAIVGMVGRFPGASNVDELWRNLCEGVESTTFFTDAQLDPSIDPDLLQDASYVKARGVIEGGETFDAAFFGITPREAEVMDPQARVFLELVHEALENAGYVADTFDGLIGLYAGCGQNTYFANHICGRAEIVNRLGEFQTMLANEKDFLTTRAAYKLDLKGPSVTISTACSTSLVAVSEAFESLNNYHCDLAIAGGISMTTPQNSGYVSQEGGMLSGDGHCRSFDVNGQGTMFNNGAGLVVLKRVDDALAAGDRIYAVIKGVGVNNDGADKVSFTAPSVDGQAQAISMAQAYADFHPETISYIEAHGTATPLGDPIEIEALTQAFRLQTNAKQFCAIGSIKSNFGHTVAAAGVAGLIKTALSLYHQQIPASLNFTTPNPNLDLEHSPFYVNTQLTPWPEGETPRRAGVSSFGVGGTNAHVVLEEAPPVQPAASYRPQQLLLLSAKTSTALDAASQNLARYLETHPDVNLADVAYTLDRGRKAFSYRRCIVGSDPVDIALALQTGDARRVLTRQNEVQQPNVVFMFPGQGSQYVNMGVTFYRDEPVFRDVVDRCAEILTPVLGRDIRDVMYPADGDKDTAEISLKQTLYTQPALFVTEYALAQLWISWGIIPQATIGHSIGEFVSACLAGVFSLADALRLVAARGRLMWDLPGGAMLSVRLAAAEVTPRLTADLAIAAINGPSLCVVSGPIGSIESLELQLTAEEIACRQLQTSHAFHSPMMDPIVTPFAEVVTQIELSPPQMPFISTVSGTWITDEQATDANYWATHLRQTVRFAAGIQTLWQQAWVLLEVGPRQTAATLARQQVRDGERQIAISSLSDRADDGAEWTALLQAIGQLWLAGRSILPADSTQSAPQTVRKKIPLPTYPFERQRFWIDPLPHPNRQLSSQIVTQTAALTHPLPQTEPAMSDRDRALIPLLKAVIEETSGLEMTGVNPATTFLEMGLDSLSLTQVGLALKKKFKVKVTLRQLLEVYPNFGTLAEFMTQTVAPELLPVTVTPAVVDPPAVNAPVIAPVVSVSAPAVDRNGSRPPVSLPSIATSGLESLFNQQLQIMAQQLALLGNRSLDSSTIANIQPPTLPAIVENSPPPVGASEPGGEQVSLDPGLLQSRIKLLDVNKSQTKTLTSAQRQCLDKIIQTYTQKTLKSKEFAQSHRAQLADPRTAAGFNPVMKEMVYPIVIARSSGAKLWDLDDNEYVDLSNGFGLNLFGWSPPFINDAIETQLKLGMEIGPQTPLVGEVAQLMCELTNFDRAAFCNTGSEAVMAALRMARTITGRNLIVIFSGAYHGMHDEVIVRGSKKLRSIPAAPGIPPEMVENLLVIDYDAPNILEILNSRADELAGVMVESVQSRRPEFQPKQLLQQLREFTTRVEIPLIFDEVVTGFRIHPGGAQAHFGIKADIATYGKIVGGGLPIGVVAGTSQYMDALDGGWWQFGDDSIPEVGVTYFAGTFVRHPLAMAAAKAVLTHLKQSGPSLQQNLNAKTDRFVAELVEYLHQMQAPVTVHNFGSLFMVKYTPDFAYGDLLFYLLRSKGVHIWDGRPCFLTTAHTDADLALVMSAFKATITELQAGGFLTTPAQPAASPVPNSNGKLHNPPPQTNAKLGRDPQGNPAWYVPDPKRPGKYLQIAGSFAQ